MTFRKDIYYPECHPVIRMGKTNYTQQHMAYFLSANRDRKAFYMTINNYTNLQLFWWNFPHLIINCIPEGLTVKFPACHL